MKRIQQVFLVILALVPTGCSGRPIKPTIASFTASHSVLGKGSINPSWNVRGADNLSTNQEVGVVMESSTATVNVMVTALGTLDWKIQLGSSADDYAYEVATDSSGNVFIAGSTGGAIAGSNAGSSDAFLVKYDPSGNEVWRKQLGTSALDEATGVSTDSGGNVFIAGTTGGAITVSNAGGSDAFLVKYDPSGNEVWRKQLGSSVDDYAFGVSTDSGGNVFIAGDTLGAITGSNAGREDIFLVKYDPNGNEAWRQQLGSGAVDQVLKVATDSNGNVFIAGSTEGAITGSNAGEIDAILVKYDPSGNEVWKKQLGGSASDFSNGVATDNSGNVFIAGSTEGAIAGSNAGSYDAFLAKYDPSGSEVWKKQLGGSASDFANGVATDNSGNVFMAGSTEGAIAGSNAGETDAFLVKYDPSGNEVWKRQLGGSEFDIALGVATDNSGNVFMAGSTEGAIAGSNAGSRDAFVVRYK